MEIEKIHPVHIGLLWKLYDLQTTTEITLNLINDDSCLPNPVRQSDLETKLMEK